MKEKQLLRKYKTCKKLSTFFKLVLICGVAILALPTVLLSFAFIPVSKALHEIASSMSTIKTFPAIQQIEISKLFAPIITTNMIIVYLLLLFAIFEIYLTTQEIRIKFKIIKSMSRQVIAVNYTSDFGSHSAIYLKKDSPWRKLIMEPNAPSPFRLKDHNGRPSDLPHIFIKNALDGKR